MDLWKSPQALGSQYAVPRCRFSGGTQRTTTGHHDTGAQEEKPGGAEAVTLPEEEPGEMENEICPETMSQLALTNSISPKELLTCRKRVTEWK